MSEHRRSDGDQNWLSGAMEQKRLEEERHQAWLAHNEQVSRQRTKEFVDLMRAHNIGTIAVYGREDYPEMKTVGRFKKREEPTGRLVTRHVLRNEGWVVEMPEQERKVVTPECEVYACSQLSTTSEHPDITRTPYVTVFDLPPEPRAFAYGDYLATTAIKLINGQQ